MNSSLIWGTTSYFLTYVQRLIREGIQPKSNNLKEPPFCHFDRTIKR